MEREPEIKEVFEWVRLSDNHKPVTQACQDWPQYDLSFEDARKICFGALNTCFIRGDDAAQRPAELPFPADYQRLPCEVLGELAPIPSDASRYGLIQVYTGSIDISDPYIESKLVRKVARWEREHEPIAPFSGPRALAGLPTYPRTSLTAHPANLGDDFYFGAPDNHDPVLRSAVSYLIHLVYVHTRLRLYGRPVSPIRDTKWRGSSSRWFTNLATRSTFGRSRMPTTSRRFGIVSLRRPPPLPKCCRERARDRVLGAAYSSAGQGTHSVHTRAQRLSRTATYIVRFISTHRPPPTITSQASCRTRGHLAMTSMARRRRREPHPTTWPWFWGRRDGRSSWPIRRCTLEVKWYALGCVHCGKR